MKPGIFNLICPHCKAEVLENSLKFDNTRPANGSMFRKKEGVKTRAPFCSMGHVRGQNFACPMCFMPVCTPGGKVKLRFIETGEAYMTGGILPQSGIKDQEFSVEVFTDGKLKRLWDRKMKEKVEGITPAAHKPEIKPVPKKKLQGKPKPKARKRVANA